METLSQIRLKSISVIPVTKVESLRPGLNCYKLQPLSFIRMI